MSAEKKRQRRTVGTPSQTEKAWHDDLLRRYEAMIGEWRRAHNPTTHPGMNYQMDRAEINVLLETLATAASAVVEKLLGFERAETDEGEEDRVVTDRCVARATQLQQALRQAMDPFWPESSQTTH